MTGSAEPEAELLAAVARAAGEALGGVFRPGHRQSRHGDGGARGECITAADGRRVFLKSVSEESADELLCERDGLEAIGGTGAVRVPAVLAHGHAGGRDFLLLEYLELHPLDDDGAALMGEALARLHADAGECFGWHRDNLIGRGRQPNGELRSWTAFWRERRLGHQLSLLHAAGGDRRTLELGERLMDGLESRLGPHRPQASLLHGDLWCGNLGQDAQGRPLVFDPAVYRGDREADLAMTALFGGVPAALARRYRSAWPLADGHEWRRDLYNLYHVLNHAVLFGGGYEAMATRMMERLLAA